MFLASIAPICLSCTARAFGRATDKQISGLDTQAVSGRTKQEKRLLRQFGVLQRNVPGLRGPIQRLLSKRAALVRVPLAILLILGGLVAVLPFFGLWMMPLGLLLLAVDLPVVQPAVAAAAIRGRRRLSTLRRYLRAKWRPR